MRHTVRGRPPTIQQCIETAFAAGSKGRPKKKKTKAGRKINIKKTVVEETSTYQCSCGKTFPRERNLSQHSERCHIIKSTQVVSSPRKKKAKVDVVESSPETIYREDQDTLKLLMNSKYY